MMDYVILNRVRRSSVLAPKVYIGCKVLSDHILVVLMLRVKLNAQKKQMKNRKYDVDGLKMDQVRVEYEASIGGRFAALANREDIDAEEMLTRFKTTTNEVAKDGTGFIKRRHRALSEKQRRLRVEADNEMDVKRRACFRAKRWNTLHNLHRSLKDDENKF